MKRLLFSSMISLFSVLNLQATHNRAGEITYTQINDSTVVALITTYTKTSSVSADRDSLTICWGDGNCQSIVRVNGAGDPPQGEALAFDYKRNLYRATYTYQQLGTYTISMTDPNRNGGILNVNFPNSEQVRFHIESTITLLDLDQGMENNAPAPLIPPLNLGYVGQAFVHVLNAIDLEGDSISYELITPLQAPGEEVPNYVMPNMISPGSNNQLSLNPETGKLVWDAPQKAGEYNIAIAIKSYRNGVELGRVIRDMQILIEEADTVLPDLSLNPSYNESEIICVSAGDTIRIDILGTSLMPEQTLQLSAFSELLTDEMPSAAFSFDNAAATGSFFWIVDESLARTEPYQLTFKVEDDGDLANFTTLRFAVESCEGNIPLSRIYGFCYQDLNQNGIQDPEDPPLLNIRLKLSEISLTTFSNQNGQFNFFVPADIYELRLLENSCWELTTGEDSFQINLGEGMEAKRSFGFKPAPSDVGELSVSLNAGPTRCSSEVPFWISLKNTGCFPQMGWVALSFDTGLSVLSDQGPSPDVIDANTLWWELDSLAVGAVEVIELYLTMAGSDFTGDTLQYEAMIFSENCTAAVDHSIQGPWDPANASFNLCQRYIYRSELRCSFDPNDKRVQPDREENENYTLFTEELEYTVRFQNTGNDTAFLVVIRDTLDQNLDWSTFRPFSASHPYEVVLNEKIGVLTFTFDNILLPDSISNEAGSHGFITYTIRPKTGLAEDTPVRNRAGIYFDRNPPIITNTTLNTLVSQLPGVSVARDFRITNLAVDVYPNPFSDELQFKVDDQLAGPVWLQIFDFSGRMLYSARHDLIEGSGVISVPGDSLEGSDIFLYKIWMQRAGKTGKVIRLK
ncbi:MAG: hypothetical protein R2828_00780 [Saprospiraceae bacterium]